MTRRTRSVSISRVWNTPPGNPPRGRCPRCASAHCGTFEACLSRPTFPAISAGAAKRKTCQNGKFHGMMARIGPIGWKVTKLRLAAGLHDLVGQEALAFVRVVATAPGTLFRFLDGCLQGLAHLDHHDPAELLLVRIENLGSTLQQAGSFSNRGTAIAEEGSGPHCRRASNSGSDSGEKVRIICPVAGLTVAIVMPQLPFFRYNDQHECHSRTFATVSTTRDCFLPAGLGMREAVDNFARYISDRSSWALAGSWFRLSGWGNSRRPRSPPDPAWLSVLAALRTPCRGFGAGSDCGHRIQPAQ